ncbi:hypothetical protein B0H13DRAFT_1906511 [Mycena leptocephala]|nr:hypothetical protein B0H13DRAFT_1906511 [Mycena leptocephala]
MFHRLPIKCRGIGVKRISGMTNEFNIWTPKYRGIWKSAGLGRTTLHYCARLDDLNTNSLTPSNPYDLHFNISSQISLGILHFCVNFDAIPDLADLAIARKNEVIGRPTTPVVAAVNLCCAALQHTNIGLLTSLNYTGPMPYDIGVGCTPLGDPCELLACTCQTSLTDNLVGINCAPFNILVPTNDKVAKQLLSLRDTMEMSLWASLSAVLKFGPVLNGSPSLFSEIYLHA